MKASKTLITSLLLSLGLVSHSAFASEFVYITTGQDMTTESLVHMKSNHPMEIVKEENGISLIKVHKDSLEDISHVAHEEHKRCGGYIFHDSLEEAQKEMNSTAIKAFAKEVVFADYSLDQEVTVQNLLPEVTEIKIRETILKLSSFKNRYYQSRTGVESQDWLYDLWKSFAPNRSDFTVEKYEHPSWMQPTVIATIKGKSDETIVIGGHGDSIAGFWGRANAKAPGADDNASGIATLTEVLRVLLNSNYKPEKTIQFMSYAAEEVGLRGSKEMARMYKGQNKNVIGVLQLDMTNYNGSSLDILLVNDFTNEAQNKFLGSLIDKYLPGVSWGYTKCGYACSDHASWTGEGFPASAPFEAEKRDMNGHIHTSRDTLDQSDGTADHAQKFAKLALAYALELDR